MNERIRARARVFLFVSITCSVGGGNGGGKSRQRKRRYLLNIKMKCTIAHFAFIAPKILYASLNIHNIAQT